MEKKAVEEILNDIVVLANRLDAAGEKEIAVGLDFIAHSVIERFAGEKINYKDWEVTSEGLKGDDWALNVSRGEEEEMDSPILVKIQNGVMKVKYQGDIYTSGIQFKSPYFYSDRFKNSIARAFRGLQTGKVSFTQVEEMYDLKKTKEGKDKKKKMPEEEKSVDLDGGKEQNDQLNADKD